MTITEFAPAKVNLWLRVTGRRPDGYHLLDSLVVFASVGDTLRAENAAELTLEVDGPFAAALPPASENNLVLRAARMLAPGRTAALRLTKTLPVASGIGGGSADAAATIRALTRLWDMDPAIGERIAPGLGADVPVCLAGKPAIMRGIGDRLLPAPPLPSFAMLLVNPGFAVETAAVFRRRSGAFAPEFTPHRWVDAAALGADITAAGNDLTEAAIAECPVIAEVLLCLRGLPGVLMAQMSGSGATCFALFKDSGAARAAASRLPKEWWSASGRLE